MDFGLGFKLMVPIWTLSCKYSLNCIIYCNFSFFPIYFNSKFRYLWNILTLITGVSNKLLKKKNMKSTQTDKQTNCL